MELKEGIVIKSTKYLENSKLINILTKEGLKTYLVKGGMKLTHKASSYTQDVSLIQFDYSSGKGFDILTSGKVIDSYLNIKIDFKRLEYVYLIFELISELSNHVNDNNTLYNFTVYILEKINNSKYYNYYYLVYSLKLLYLLGVGPEFAKCVRCGTKENIIGFDFNSSGNVCSNCINHSELLYSSETVKYLKVLYITKLDCFSDEYLSRLFEENDKYKDIYTFISRYYSTYLGFKSKAIKVFGSISNI